MSTPNSRLVPTLTEVLEASVLQSAEKSSVDPHRFEQHSGSDLFMPDLSLAQESEPEPELFDALELKLDAGPDPSLAVEAGQEDQLSVAILDAVDAAIDEFRAQLLQQLEPLLAKVRVQRSERT